MSDPTEDVRRVMLATGQVSALIYAKFVSSTLRVGETDPERLCAHALEALQLDNREA